MENRKRDFIKAVAVLLVAVVSFFLIAGIATSTETSWNQETIQYLGEKQTTVMELTAATTAASTVITLIPGDAGTPIANKLADFSSYFLIVLCAVLLEKYLVTIMGFAAFKILIPIGCLVLAGSFLTGGPGLRDIGKKLCIFGLMISLIIPSSVGVSKMIETTYAESIEQSLEQAKDEEVEEEAEALAEDAMAEAEKETATEAEVEEESSGNIFSDVYHTFVDNVKDGIEIVETAVADKTTDVTEKARNMMSRFMEALAVMLVTSCLIPILVIVFFLWLCKILLGADLGGRFPMMPPMPPRRKQMEE